MEKQRKPAVEDHVTGDRQKSSRKKTKSANRTNCPECNMDLSVDALKRHLKEKHSNDEKLNCIHCTYTAKRMSTLKDHVRRTHIEPKKLA